ncbi:extracellular solute-binding protein [Paenibacillus sp. GCM10012303]|uniref:extracellular solute-binding protein n=1 Tax=Paenibacillus sp. GCM10012303 TaxID=3317340 RepID=UPI003613C6FB
MLKKRNEFEERIGRLRSDLWAEIREDRLAPGDFLLSERMLSQKYNLSHISVRKVLAELEEAGLVEKMPGKGTKVKARLPEKVQKTLRAASYGDSHENPIIRSLLKSYTELHPEVAIDFTAIPAGAYLDTVFDALEKNCSSFDVLFLSDLHFRTLVERGLEGSLQSWESSKEELFDHLYPQTLRMFRNTEQKAIPFAFSPVVYCYNKKLVCEDELNALSTWPGLLEVAKRHTIKDEAGNIQQYGFGFSISNHRWPLYLLQNEGGFVSGDGRRSRLSDPKTVEAFQFCLDLMYEVQASPIFVQGSTRFAESLFLKEKVAFLLTTYYFMNEFASSELVWDIVPVIPSGVQAATLMIGTGIAVPSDSEHKEEAARLIRYLTSKPAQETLKLRGNTIPANRDAAEDQSLLQSSVHPSRYPLFEKLLPYVHSLLELEMSPSEMGRLQEELFLMWMNMEKPHDACRRIERDWLIEAKGLTVQD